MNADELRAMVSTNPQKVLGIIRPKVLKILDEINLLVQEKENETLAVVLSLLSGTDGAVVGAGGIAKSLLMRNILGKKPGEGRIDGAHAFMLVFQGDTRPADLWSSGIGTRKTDHGDGTVDTDYIPRVEGRGADPRVRALYFDEFSMGPDKTQESARSAMSDREAYVLGQRVDLDHVWSVWISTNALPKGPLNWRLVCKLEAQEVIQESNQLKMMVASELRKKLARLKARGFGQNAADELILGELAMWEDEPEMMEYINRFYEIYQNPTRLSMDEFEILRDLVFQVQVPPTIKREQLKIRSELATKGVHVDGRRFVRTIPMVMAHAVLVSGELIAAPKNLAPMQHAWAEPGEARKFREVVYKHANDIAADAQRLVDQAMAIAQEAIASQDLKNGRFAISKIKSEIVPQFAELIDKARDQEMPVEDVKAARSRAHEQIATINNALMGTDF